MHKYTVHFSRFQYQFFSFFLLYMVTVFITGCSESGKVEVMDTSKMHHGTVEEVDQIVEAFMMAKDSTTITLPAGFYEFNTQLILDNAQKVTIKGAGMKETILSFKTLKAGGEGMKVVGNNLVLEDFAVWDAPGDGIKAQHCDGLVFRRVHATWTNQDKTQNGTYALYPVQSKNVVLDGCIASHSRDAGIYVGQSENIIVKNCIAYGNVAGIEIENSDNAEVFDNQAYDNAGGVLVFNLPDLPKAEGNRTRVYNNEIIDNNHDNFSRPINEGNNGNAVTMIPPGSGVILLAAKNVEIFNNRILRNKTVGVAIASYQITGFKAEAPNWSPYTRDVSVHDNEYERPGALPDMTKDLGKLLSMKNPYGIGKTQDIVYDGIWDKNLSADVKTNPMNICVREKNMDKLHFSWFFLMDGEDKIESFKDATPFTCDFTVKTEVEYLNEL